MATFKYFIIGGDGKTYPQQIYVNEGRFDNFNDFQAEAQRLINTELQDSGAVQLTLPDLSTGQETLVPEAQKNYNSSNGTTNLGGRTINLTNPAGVSIYQGGSSPLLPAGSNIPTLPGMLNASSPGTNPSTFYGDAGPVNYGTATPGFANSAGQTSAGNVPFDINNQLMMQGATQGPTPLPFAFNPEFSAPGTIDTRTPIREFEGDVMEGGGESLFAPPPPEPEIIEKIEQDPNVREYLEQTRVISNPNFDRIDRFTGQMTRRLINQEESSGGTTYRHYQYSYKRDGRQIVEDVFMLVDGNEVNSFSPERSETPITENAYSRKPNITSLQPSDLIVTGTKTGIAVNDIREAYARNSNTDSANFPDWFTDTLALSGLQFREDESTNLREKQLGYKTYNLRGLDSSLEIDPRTGEASPKSSEVSEDPSEPVVSEEPVGSGVGDVDTSVSSPDGPGSGASPLGPGGPGQILDQTGNIARIEDVPGEFLDFEINEALSNFLATSPSLSLNLPVDAQGNRRNITPEDFPGFPAEILDPNNLFIRVTETTSIPDADGNMIPATTTKVVPNPAVELLLAQYAERIRGLTDLQGSADDILQAQISASGGFFGGPTGSLDIGQLEDLERETRSIQASGGRLVQEALVDAEGNRTGQYKEILTPLGQAELDEATAARQQLLQQEALRQSGGLLGGFYSPLDAQGNPLEAGQQRFIGGLTPQQLLGRQEEEARKARQQELEILERQREVDLQLARINQSPQQFRNIADLYSNPAQLAAIVASGGSPLLRGQLPGSSPIPQTSMQTGAMASQAQTASAPFNITNPSGTVFDPNFVPVGGRTQEGDLRRQEANPFNVRDFSGVTEQRLRNLSDIELARAQGEAAAQGITPTSLEEIGTRNTPGGPLDKTGFLAPKTLFY